MGRTVAHDTKDGCVADYLLPRLNLILLGRFSTGTPQNKRFGGQPSRFGVLRLSTLTRTDDR